MALPAKPAGRTASDTVDSLVAQGRLEEAIANCDFLMSQHANGGAWIARELAGTMAGICGDAAMALESLGLFAQAEAYRRRAFDEATKQAYGPGPHKTTAPISTRAIDAGGSLCDNLMAQGKSCRELRASVELARWLRR